MSSLASLQLSLELGTVALAGLLLLALQILAGTIAANVIIKVPPELGVAQGGPTGAKRRQGIRRTAAVQLGTMAPATSVFSFTREFAGPLFVGFAALADMPSKAYMLIFLPAVAKLRGDEVGRREAADLASGVKEEESVVQGTTRRGPLSVRNHHLPPHAYHLPPSSYHPPTTHVTPTIITHHPIAHLPHPPT
mmetsp:Transcript_48053/g.134216  ORF Transcript_48053/g.134216 Transcript_48053/m.134216 type:complete len:193 (-) Transcript_48053:459-1037(-)